MQKLQRHHSPDPTKILAGLHPVESESFYCYSCRQVRDASAKFIIEAKRNGKDVKLIRCTTCRS